MTESVHSLAALRRHIATLDRKPTAGEAQARFPVGHGGIDGALDGGFARGRVHELFGGSDEEGAASGFALILAQLASGDAPLLWLRTDAAVRAGGAPYGPGLAALGLDSSRLLIGVMADDAMLLRAAVDGLRCPALGALVIELRGRAPLLDLTASRRLALAAEGSGVTAFMLRIGGDPAPSAADTRWRVEAAPSLALLGDGPGMSAFTLTLLRRRSGRDGLDWQLMWDSEKRVFKDAYHERDDDRNRHDDGNSGGAHAALSGAMVPLLAVRPAARRPS